MVIWITGLSGSGKTTLATALYESMKPRLSALVRIDGDEVRTLLGNPLVGKNKLLEKIIRHWRYRAAPLL
jgi:adenylylsulfate kinase-like enzyme